MTSYYSLIQNALILSAKSGVFKKVSYFDDQAVVTDQEAKITSAEANEISCDFGLINVRNRREYVRERQSWRWSLIVSTDSMASDEDFVALFNDQPFRIPPTDGLRAVALELRSVNYEHPPRANPTRGSTFRYDVEAKQAPR